jgi:hypothetical protein
MDDKTRALLGDREAAKRLTDAEVLLPCAHCGGEAEYIERGNEKIGLKETVVRCKKCGTRQIHKWLRYKFDFFYVRNNTLLEWNTRAPILSAEEMEMLEGVQ